MGSTGPEANTSPPLYSGWPSEFALSGLKKQFGYLSGIPQGDKSLSRSSVFQWNACCNERVSNPIGPNSRRDQKVCKLRKWNGECDYNKEMTSETVPK